MTANEPAIPDSNGPDGNSTAAMDKDSGAPVGIAGSAPPDPATFASYLGQACWLMSVSAEHKSMPMSDLDHRVLPAILLKQFRLFLKDKQPIAFLSWAKVSDAVLTRFEQGEPLQFKEWRSGDNLLIVECISPFGPAEKIKNEFVVSMQST